MFLSTKSYSLSASISKITIRQYSQHRAHNRMPLAMDNPKAFENFKTMNAPKLWSRIVMRPTHRVGTPKKDEWPKDRDTLVRFFHAHGKRALPVLRRFRGLNYGGFKSHMYQAIKLDRPDLLMFLKDENLFGAQVRDYSMLARMHLHLGQEAEARALCEKLAQDPGRLALGYLGLLVALREFAMVDRIIKELRNNRIGIRAQFFDLLNAPFSSELPAMLEYADRSKNLSLKKVFRMQVIRAYLHKHEFDKALDLYKTYYDFLKDASVPTTGQGEHNIRWGLQIAHQRRMREMLQQLAEGDTSKRAQVMDKYYKDFVKYLIPAEVLKAMSKHEIADPMVMQIWRDASISWRRGYFEHISPVFVTVFKRQNKLDELQKDIKEMSAESRHPEPVEAVNMIRYYLALEEYEKAFELFMANTWLLHQSVNKKYLDLFGVRKLQQEILRKAGTGEFGTKVAESFRTSRYLTYPSKDVQMRAMKEQKDKEKADKERELMLRAAEAGVPGVIVPGMENIYKKAQENTPETPIEVIESAEEFTVETPVKENNAETEEKAAETPAQ